jgi:hypothetical protein
MDWTETATDGPTDAETTRREWERADGYAVVIVRETATGEWAVSLDRLEQAPGGPTYRRESRADREAALELAATWREANGDPE